MSLLVGLPLTLFRLLFMGLRLLVPILLILLVIWLVRRIRQGGGSAGHHASQDPEFDGPVYTVDYREVKDDEEEPPK